MVATVCLIFCVLLSFVDSTKNAAPTFLSSPTNINASIGDLVKLLCRVSGPPETEYWWEKDENRLRKSKKYRLKNLRYLRIKKVDKSDAGEYVCWASYRGSKIHQTITLNVQDPQSSTSYGDIAPYFTEKRKMKKDYLVYPAGNKLKIVCSANGRPKPSVRWYKDNKELKYMPDGVTPLTNTSFEVIFESLKPKHAGEYKCQVSNKAGVIEKAYTVKVKEMMVVKPILQSIKNITAYEGDDVTITCKAVSDSRPHFQWVIKQNNTFKVLDPGLRADEYVWKSDSDRWHGVNLRLVNVSQKDERDYYCIFADDRGYDYQKFQLSVIPRPVTREEVPTGKPEFVPEPYQTKVGETVVLKCAFINWHVSWRMIWYVHGKIIQPQIISRFRFVTGKSSFLVINNVQKKDAGIFKCAASNAFGTVSKKFNLKVVD